MPRRPCSTRCCHTRAGRGASASPVCPASARARSSTRWASTWCATVANALPSSASIRRVRSPAAASSATRRAWSGCALEDAAYIRPSPARGFLGGVARHTRETILLCEAAGFGTILVETVGVGQSETAVRSMTDFFLLLLLPGAGDQLQGIKRGIIEMVDAVAITKADGDLRALAERARVEYRAALHLFPAAADGWSPPVVTCSAVTPAGISEIWDLVLAHRAHMEANGQLASRRRAQSVAWMRELVGTGLDARVPRASSRGRVAPGTRGRGGRGPHDRRCGRPSIADALPGITWAVGHRRAFERRSTTQSILRHCGISALRHFNVPCCSLSLSRRRGCLLHASEPSQS